MTAGHSLRRELIVYATPTGELGEQCARYWRAAADLGATEAQAYPPHCTLTGFFRRREGRADEIAERLRARLADPWVPADAVDTVGLRRTSEWVGLELASPWLEAATRRWFADHRLDDGDDPIRFKTDLHLSLAYDVAATDARSPGRDLTPYWLLAVELIDPAASVRWEVALWERAVGGWRRLTP